MENFNQFLCEGDPSFLGLFDFSYAPQLIFYAYFPVMIVALFLGFLVFSKEKSVSSKTFFAITIIYSFALLNDFFQWITVNARINHWEWQMAGILQISIFILSLYFVYVFINKKDLSFWGKLVLVIATLPVIVTLPTKLNMLSFDLINCQSNNGYIWSYIYVVEIIIIVFIGWMCLKKCLDKSVDIEFRKQVFFLMLGAVLFLSIFTATNVFGDSTFLYQINLLGPIGMISFLGLLTFMIVRFKTFNIRLFGAQALVIALGILIVSKLFTAEAGASRTITYVTLAFVAIFGYNLIKSVQKEIKTREKIELLATELEGANARLRELDRQKSEFVSIASHQLRAPLTAIKGYLSMVLEGDYGNIVEGALRETLERTFESTNNLVTIVSDFLDVSRIEQGRMVYDWSDFDLKDVAETVVHELTEPAQKRKLSLTFSVEPGTTFMVHGDKNKLKQVFTNLVDNSIKYTPAGKVEVSVSRPLPKVVRFMVKDTGIGMDKSTLVKLFEKFSRANDASQTNAIGTGLGLFVAKEMIKAHEGGKIWAESEGKGKGSSFIVELRGL